jgi:hypothetical protein
MPVAFSPPPPVEQPTSDKSPMNIRVEMVMITRFFNLYPLKILWFYPMSFFVNSVNSIPRLNASFAIYP